MGVDRTVTLIAGVDVAEARGADGRTLLQSHLAGAWGPPPQGGEGTLEQLAEWINENRSGLEAFLAGDQYDDDAEHSLLLGVVVLRLSVRDGLSRAKPASLEETHVALVRAAVRLRELGVEAPPRLHLAWEVG